MATIVPDMNCARKVADEFSQERVMELTRMIGRQLPMFHRIALRKLNNVADAEDAVQDALLAAYTHLRQFRGQAQLSTWLTAIVINSVRMKLRRRQCQMLIQLEGKQRASERFVFRSLSDDRSDPEEIYRYREVSQLLHHSFRRLSPTIRATFRLRAMEGLSIRETAHVLKVPVGTVKTRLARARSKLKQMMHQIRATA